jgi:lipoyl(octanoyl) transferase
MRKCDVRDLGRIGFAEAYALQLDLVSRRKEGLIADQLLFVEHPHVVTMGRNGHRETLLASEDWWLIPCSIYGNGSAT